MNLMIVEDEPLIAKRIARLSREILQEMSGKPPKSVTISSTLSAALTGIQDRKINLLLLDLNLHGKDGFDLLKEAASGAFHTIVISANGDKALTAFDHGVLDFVSKPFTKERLQKAFARYFGTLPRPDYATRYLSVRSQQGLTLVRTSDILYIQGSGIYSTLHVIIGKESFLCDKTLKTLEQILPAPFFRVHKSYMVNLDQITHFRSHGGSKYDLVLSSGELIPVSRTRYKALKQRLS